MKERFLVMGTILSLLGLGLMASRGTGIGYVALLGLGIVLLIAGVLWRRPQPRSPA